MQNRHNDTYSFQAIDENTYTITGNLKYWRYGGLDGQDHIDWQNLGFVDPSGGPFIGLGYKIEGRKVTRIHCVGENILFEVENQNA